MSTSSNDGGKSGSTETVALQNNERKLRIDIDPQTAGGIYANMAMVSHSRAEFVTDFIFLAPQRLQGSVRSRVITSPAHFKRLVAAMEENLRGYEREFGPIPEEIIPDIPDPTELN